LDLKFKLLDLSEEKSHELRTMFDGEDDVEV
jgi:hypothetical protein